MAMLNSNPPMFTTHRNALIPSVGGRFVFPPQRPLSLASRRGRDSHVPNIFRDLLRRGNASGSPEVSRIREDDVEVVDSDYDDDDVGGDEDEDEIGDDVFVLGLGSRMQKWFENKPSGFGDGKVYDTSIEDKLLEEMQQSRIAQAANINRLKHSGGNGGDKAPGQNLKKKKKNEVAVEEEDEVVPTGVQVRVGNLPKKKNIHRDLSLAFKGFAGLSAVVPAVAGNKKTRDPVCLGFAHVYLETEEDALRFVRTFSGQAMTFGRVQKQIKCGMTNQHTEISAQQTIIDEDPESDSNLALTVVEKYPFMSSRSDEDDVVVEEFQLMDENSEYFIVSDFDDVEDGRKPLSLPSSLDRQKKAAGAVKPRAKSRPVNKPPGKGKSGKVPKLEIPGSAKRLKIREKAVLTGVLSKYQAMAASTTSDS